MRRIFQESLVLILWVWPTLSGSGGAILAEDTRPLRIGCVSVSPMMERDVHGRSVGYAVEYFERLMLYSNLRYEFVGEGEPWGELLRMLRDGEIDLLACATKYPEREEEFSCSHLPMGFGFTRLSVRAGDRRFISGDYPQWNGIRIGLLKGLFRRQLFPDFASAHGITGFSEHEYESRTELKQALQNGDIDAIMDTSLRREEKEWVIEEFDPSPYYILVRRENTDLLARVDRAMEKLDRNQPGLKDELNRKYYRTISGEQLTFDTEERRFTETANRENQVFTAISDPDFPPFSFVEEGHPSGEFRRIGEEVFRRTGLKFRWLIPADREEYNRIVSTCAVDVIVGSRFSYSTAAERGYIVTEPFCSPAVSLVKRLRFSGPIRRLAILEHSSFRDQLETIYPTSAHEYRRFRHVHEAFEAVDSGVCDAVCLYSAVAEYHLSQNYYPRLTSEVIPAIRSPFSFAIRRSTPMEFSTLVARSLASMGEVDVLSLEYSLASHRFDPPTLSDLCIMYPGTTILLVGNISLIIVVLFIWIYILRVRAYRRLQRAQDWTQKLLRALPGRIGILDQSEKILFLSAQDLKGTDPVTIRYLREVPRSDYDKVSAAVREVFETHQSRVLEYDSHGTRRAMFISPVPPGLFDEEAVIWFSHDNTELQETRRQAEESAEWFRLTLDSIGDGVLTTDREGRITMINPVAERMLGYTKEEVFGWPHERIFRIFSYEDDLPTPSPVLRALRTGSIVELANHTDLEARDGRRFHISDSAAPIFASDGGIIGAILVFRDVTEEYLRRDQLRQAVSLLETGSRITRSATFRFDPKTREVNGSGILPQLIPLREGRLEEIHWISEEDRPEVIRRWSQLESGEVSSTTFDYRVKTEDGVRYHHMYSEVDHSDPRRTMYTSVVQDVTELRQTFNQLEEQRNLWELAIHSIPLMFFIRNADDDFRYVLCNQSFADFVGRTREDVIGRTDEELFGRTEDIIEFRRWNERIMRTVEGEVFEESAVDSQGILHRIQTVKKPFTGHDGTRLLLGISTDITELKLHIDNERAINFCLETFFRATDPEKAISDVLAKITEHLNASYVWVMQFDTERFLASSYLEHHAEDLERLFLCTDRPFGAEEPWFRKLMNHETLIVSDYESPEAQDDAGSWQSLFAEKDVRSIFVTGLWLGKDHLWGDLGVAYAGRSYSPSDLEKQFLQHAGNLIGHLLTRQRADQRLVETAERAKAANENKAALLRNERIINQGMQAVLNARVPSDAAPRILELICDRLQATRCFIMKFDLDQEMIVPLFEHLSRPDLRSSREEGGFPLRGSSSLSQLDQPIIVEDVNDPAAIGKYHLWKEMNQRYDLRSLCLVGFRVNGEPWGDLGVTYEGESHCLTDDERLFLTAAMHLVQLMIQRDDAHTRLLGALEEAQAANRARSFFIANISHEIRTPLNAVVGFAELLRDDCLDAATRRDFLDSIVRSGEALLQIVNDVLDLSKLEVNRMEIITESTDFRLLCEDVMRIFVLRAAERDVKLEIRIPQIPWLELDRMRVRQILFNLISNAVRFTTEGTVKLSAIFTPENDGEGRLLFAVTDTGIGISQEDQERLMKPFVQLSRQRGTSAANNGTGLGLAICKRLVEKMNGHIRIRSTPGQGSTFRVTMSQVRIATQRPGDRDPSTVTPYEQKAMSILLVDDVEMNLKVMKAMCVRAGIHDIVTATGGREALTELRKRSFSSILTDLWMPGM
ncbi:MAG: PAS domain S-box protein, partial [Planctomycetia bacterium]|nr:PAS domain S-box protein [Planctomycetia bacterium]